MPVRRIRLWQIRGEVDARRALLARDLGFADVAAAIATTEDAWRRGEIDPVPPGGEL